MEKQYISAKEFARLKGRTEQWVTSQCRKGAIRGAVKVGKSWQMPCDILNVGDSLNTKKEFVLPKESTLPLPVGISDYCTVENECYYVDKTLLIKELLDEHSSVILFTRPRRFGKTLTIDMLKVFFELNKQDTSVHFRKRKIWKCDRKYQELQGKFPVIALSFKDVKFTSWEDSYEKIGLLLQAEYNRHKEILISDRLSDFDKAYFAKVANCTASKVALTEALGRLSAMLAAVYEQKVLVLIDEYDTPVQQGFYYGFYDEVLNFMRLLLSSVLKDNTNLFKGVLTGILRISKENLFSGLNNLVVDTVLSKKYSSYFGFTIAEVEMMAQYYGSENKLAELREWYDGYRFGDMEIYNPWSVTNYFNNLCDPQAYWINTSENSILRELLAEINEENAYELTNLLQGNSILAKLNLNIIYPKLQHDTDAVYSFLLMAGYLKAVGTLEKGYFFLALPNYEIKEIYRDEVLAWIQNNWQDNVANNLRKALLSQDSEQLQKYLSGFLKSAVSWFDTSTESFYHGMMLGLTAAVSDKYNIKSNRESGLGRFDLALMPKAGALPGIIMEFKAETNCTEEKLELLSNTALAQIASKEYYNDLQAHGIKNIVGYGIAFSGKKAKIGQRCFS